MPGNLATNNTPPVNMTNKLDKQVSRYDANDEASSYFRDDGYLVLPIAGPDDGTTFPERVKVHASYGLKTSKWRASKRGTPPVMPTPQDCLSGDLMLTSDITVFQPRMDANESKMSFAAEGVYTYLQNPKVTVASSVPVRKTTEFYHTAMFSYVTPLLKANGYTDLTQLGISPLLNLMLDQQTLNETKQLTVNGLTAEVGVDDYTYQRTIYSPVFFNDNMVV